MRVLRQGSRGAQEKLLREERTLATINRTIGEALGKWYVEEHFPAEAKEKAEEMIANVVQAFETLDFSDGEKCMFVRKTEL